MFCNFCGKNFDSSEGFEEVSRGGHHYVRCEKCVYNQHDEEYDWRIQMYGRQAQGPQSVPDTLPVVRQAETQRAASGRGRHRTPN